MKNNIGVFIVFLALVFAIGLVFIYFINSLQRYVAGDYKPDAVVECESALHIIHDDYMECRSELSIEFDRKEQCQRILNSVFKPIN